MDHIVATQWIGFDTASTYSSVLYFSFPLLCAIGPSLGVVEDVRSEFSLRMLQARKAHFAMNSLVISFLGGALTATIPLIVDYMFALLLFPNRVPNLLVNYNDTVLPAFTFLGGRYYTRPADIILLYIIVAGLWGGVYGLTSLLSGVLSKNLYVSMSAPFSLTVIITVVTNIIPNYVISPIYSMMPVSPEPLGAPVALLITYTTVLLLITGGGYYAIRRIQIL